MNVLTQHNQTQGEWRQVCIKFLIRTVSTLELAYLDEYISCAEKEGGEGYWAAFVPTTARLLDDFDTFLQNR